jgi:hypothetical protein
VASRECLEDSGVRILESAGPPDSRLLTPNS